jgi:hypothetical protein
MLQDTFSQLIVLSGEKTAQKFYQWGESLFLPSGCTDGEAFVWTILFPHLLLSINENDIPEAIKLKEEKTDEIAKIIHKFMGEEYNTLLEKIEDLEDQPKTKVEMLVYEEYAEDSTPLSWLQDAIRCHRFHQIWDELNLLLNVEEKSMLLKWGRMLAKDKGIPGDLVVICPTKSG